MAEMTHREFSWVLLVIVAVAAVVVLTSLTGMPQRAAAQELTPSATEPTIPEAPGFGTINGILEWIDNSDNEDGFRVYITVNDQETRTYEFPPNTTSFVIPSEARPECGSIEYAITAFNSAGETSRIPGIVENRDCFELPTPNVPPSALPVTGGGGPDGYPYALVIAALAGAGLTLTGVAGLRLRRR